MDGQKRISCGNFSKEQNKEDNSLSSTKGRKRRRNNRNRSNGTSSSCSGSSSRGTDTRCDGCGGTSDRKVCADSEADVKNNGKLKYSTVLKSLYANSGGTDDNRSQQTRQNPRSSGRRIEDDEKGNVYGTKISCEYKLYAKLARARRKAYKYQWDSARWGKRPIGARKGAEDHYPFWRNAYDRYLWEIFYRVLERINKFKKVREDLIDFQEFVDFAYDFSSGYITPYY